MSLWTALRHAAGADAARLTIDEAVGHHGGAVADNDHIKAADRAIQLAEAYTDLARHLAASRLARLVARGHTAETAWINANWWWVEAAHAEKRAGLSRSDTEDQETQED